MEQELSEVMQNLGHRTLPTLSQVSQQKNNEVMRVYGSREKFLTAFNPDVQRDICGNEELCFFGGAPTLATINATYGDMTAAMWLVPQLYNLSEYCGCRDKLQGNPLKECASVIATEFYYLKVSEVMLFFHRFKSGRYGRFYGSVDPLVITTSLREFMKERANAYDAHDREERARTMEEHSKHAVTWEKYCDLYHVEDRTHPLLRKPDVKRKEGSKEPIESVLKIARSLLADTVADDATKEQFSRMFKKKHGLTPQEYIERYSNNG